MFTRGDPDIKENVICDDEYEPLAMPEDAQGEYLNSAFNTPHNNAEPQEDSEDTD